MSSPQRIRIKSDIDLAHIFLAIDASDAGLTMDELVNSLDISQTTIQRGIRELREMGCVYREIGCGEEAYFVFNISTGHACEYCTPKLPRKDSEKTLKRSGWTKFQRRDTMMTQSFLL